MIAAISSETTKFFSYPWCVAGIAGAFMIPILYLLTLNVSITDWEQQVHSLCLQALYLGQVGIIVAGAGCFGQEFTHSALRTTLLALPARLTLLSAKFFSLTMIVICTGVAASATVILTLLMQIDVDWPFTFNVDLFVSISLVILNWIQLAWIIACLSILTKSLVAPIAIGLPLLLGMSQLLYSFIDLAKYVPPLATMNLFFIAELENYLSKWFGLAVQFAWLVIFVVISFSLFLNRSVR